METVSGQYRGCNVEVTAHWSERRQGYEVVFWLNPNGGIPTGHKTFLGVAPMQWETIKAQVCSGLTHKLT